MFGHQDNKQNDDHSADQPVEDHVSGPAEEEFVSGAHPTGHTPSDTGHADNPDGDSGWQHPGTPVDSPDPISDVVPPVGGSSKPVSLPNPSGSSNDHEPESTSNAADSELVDLRHQALQELSPLVDKLDQPAEERFRTLMMMVQATDNQSLLPKVYEAAKKIDDEQARAQALLDVINEVNYFTHPKDENNEN